MEVPGFNNFLQAIREEEQPLAVLIKEIEKLHDLAYSETIRNHPETAREKISQAYEEIRLICESLRKLDPGNKTVDDLVQASISIIDFANSTAIPDHPTFSTLSLREKVSNLRKIYKNLKATPTFN